MTQIWSHQGVHFYEKQEIEEVIGDLGVPDDVLFFVETDTSVRLKQSHELRSWRICRLGLHRRPFCRSALHQIPWRRSNTAPIPLPSTKPNHPIPQLQSFAMPFPYRSNTALIPSHAALCIAYGVWLGVWLLTVSNTVPYRYGWSIGAVSPILEPNNFLSR